MASSASSLNVIALISGGKDSMYSLLHCLALGHRVLAIANLGPPRTQEEEEHDGRSTETSDLNSYMYQTAGHGLVTLYAQALGIPLFTRPITGTTLSVAVDYDYVGRGGGGDGEGPSSDDRMDETEDLTLLLRSIMKVHPEANAVSSGAILSTYQRTRIESVAVRLGLTSLALLWQYPYLPAPVPSPAGLLRDMAAVGLDARIVKVASGGLDETMLWEDICDERATARLERALARFGGGSVLGEGGEYETLVVKGPSGVWKGELVVADGERRPNTGQGGEAWLTFSGGSVEPSPPPPPSERAEAWRDRLVRPSLWDKQFENLPAAVTTALTTQTPSGEQSHHDSPRPIPALPSSPTTTATASTLTIANITSHPPTTPPAGIATQTASVCATARRLLAAHGLDPSSLVSTTLILRSMALFAPANETYALLFPHPNPPSRIAIASALPPGIDIALSVTAATAPAPRRRSLHVRSRSYWAPANIGPYSQASALGLDADEGEREGEERDAVAAVFVAGQIPLVPATMEPLLPPTGRDGAALFLFARRAVLALQHLWRIGVEMDVRHWTGAIVFLAEGTTTTTATTTMRQKARAAWEAWRLVHTPPPPSASAADDDDDDDPGPDAWDRAHGGCHAAPTTAARRAPLPDFGPGGGEAGRGPIAVPGFFAVEVDALPLGCDVEWQSAGLAGAKHGMRAEFYGVGPGDGGEGLGRVLDAVADRANVTVYAARTADMELAGTRAQVVPCRRVWGEDGREMVAGVVVRYGF